MWRPNFQLLIAYVVVSNERAGCFSPVPRSLSRTQLGGGHNGNVLTMRVLSEPTETNDAPGGSVLLEDADGIGERLSQSQEFNLSSLAAPGTDSVIPFTVKDLERLEAATSSCGKRPDVSSDASADASPLPVVGESEPSTTPDVKKILKFAIPAIGVWLCGPLLSLIDTSAVGLLSGTAQQAGLNPAVAVTDYAALLMAFMFTATTNLVAAAQEMDRGVEGKPRTAKTLKASLQLSGYVGLGLGAILFCFARLLLRTIIGNDSIDPEVFGAAMKYVRIRALGMPAAAVIGSAQSACLGMQDIKSPLYVLGAAAAVNFLGDVIFVGRSHPLIGGAAGAAWATVFSQAAALAMFLKWLRNKPRSKISTTAAPSSGGGQQTVARRINLSSAIMEMTSPPTSTGVPRKQRFREALQSLKMSGTSTDISTKKAEAANNIIKSQIGRLLQRKEGEHAPSSDTFSTRGFLEGRLRKRDLLYPPNKETAKEFWPYVIPVTTTSVGRVSSYVAMSHVVSSALGTVGMAANQVILSLFYCLTPIADSLSLTAQSFVPGIFQRKRSPERTAALRQTTKNFYKAGAIFGAAMVGAVACIPFLSKFFTADPTVIAQVNSVAPLLAVVFSLHGMFMSSEGILLGQKDLSFLGKAYGAFFACVPWFMLRVKKAALAGVEGVGLTSVWKVFLSYQIFRCGVWALRLRHLHEKMDEDSRQVNALGAEPSTA